MSVRGQQLAERKRSNAAGLHISTSPRSSLKAQAIRQSMEDEMSEFDGDYIDGDEVFEDDVEPTDTELDAIEAEDDDFLYEDYPHEFESEMYNALGY